MMESIYEQRPQQKSHRKLSTIWYARELKDDYTLIVVAVVWTGSTSTVYGIDRMPLFRLVCVYALHEYIIHSICSPIRSLGRNRLHVYSYTIHNNNEHDDDEYDNEAARSSRTRYVYYCISKSKAAHSKWIWEKRKKKGAAQERWKTSFASHTAMWFVFWAITKPTNKLQIRTQQQWPLQFLTRKSDSECGLAVLLAQPWSATRSGDLYPVHASPRAPNDLSARWSV